MRDKNSPILLGVMAELSKILNIDVSILRLIAVIMAIFVRGTFLLYIVTGIVMYILKKDANSSTNSTDIHADEIRIKRHKDDNNYFDF